MQNSTTETQAKRNHQFDLHGSTTLTDSNKLWPPKMIQKPTTDSTTLKDSTTHADSTHDADSIHLWNPTTNSTSILELKPSQHTSEIQPMQTTTLNPVNTDSTQPKTTEWKGEKNREKRRDREIER